MDFTANLKQDKNVCKERVKGARYAHKMQCACNGKNHQSYLGMNKGIRKYGNIRKYGGNFWITNSRIF